MREEHHHRNTEDHPVLRPALVDRVDGTRANVKYQLEAAVMASPVAPENVAAYAKGLCNFLNSSWTPFHATNTVAKTLQAAGFQKLTEKEPWKALEPQGKYYFTRNGSSLVAFAIGKNYKPGDGIVVVGAHTDSPCPKLKPKPSKSSQGYNIINVQPYGGGLWHTWFDRDLSIAGRAIVKNSTGMTHQLVQVDRPIIRTSTLAIHLDRNVNSDGFKVNFQNHLPPILATKIKSAMSGEEGDKIPFLQKVVAESLKVAPEDIMDMELQVCDTQPAAIGGLYNEFIFSGRLDNLAMCYIAMESLIKSLEQDNMEDESICRMIALFDHEEVGSGSAVGAQGTLFDDSVAYITTSMGGTIADAARCVQRSFLVSADMAHAIHPNYPEKYEPDHKPEIHKGLVIKYNANQRYATNSPTSAMFKAVAEKHKLPIQEFVVRSDMACGSTIGPLMSANCGIRTIDVGAPQLSMHSVREVMGTDDVATSVKHFTEFFKEYSELDDSLAVDSVI